MRRARAMDSRVGRLVEDAEQYAGILQQCSSSEVALWKRDDLERAFHWASYFHKVHNRTAERPSVISNIDIHLRQAGRKRGVRFGGEELCYAFLSNSSHYLLKTLLENPALSLELQDTVLQYTADQSLQWHAHAETCATESSLLQCLIAVHSQLCLNKRVASSTAQGLLSTSADCYIEHFEWLLSFNSDKFQEQLKALSQETRGMELILIALLQPPPTGRAVHKAMLQWLLAFMASEQASHGVWDTDPLLLAKVSSHYVDFFKTHLQYLIGEVEGSMAVVQEGVPGDDGFQRLHSHFSALVSCGPPVRDLCLSAIASRAPSVSTHFDCCTAALLDHHPSIWAKLASSMRQ